MSYKEEQDVETLMKPKSKFKPPQLDINVINQDSESYVEQNLRVDDEDSMQEMDHHDNQLS